MGTIKWGPKVAVRALMVMASGLLLAVVATATTNARSAAGHGFRNHVFASASGISHRTAKGLETVSKPDDITALGPRIYVGFANGVGPQGQASPTGNRDSTIVEFSLSGRKLKQWDIVGKCDGLTADPGLRQVIATVNEDAHSSLYLIAPAGNAVHYRYNRPVPSNGGTDALSDYQGQVLVSGSAPGTVGKPAPQASYPAVYRLTFNGHARVATLHGLFSDEATATSANIRGSGKRVRLALTDPDSNEVVPAFAPRFSGDFMLTSQGDEEQIFVSGVGSRQQRLSVLKLSRSVDDTAWPTGPAGALYATDSSNGTVNQVTGPFRQGSVLVATTPCDQSNAPSTCPGPGFPANYLGALNPRTGAITKVSVSGPAFAPQGMLFRP
jgi:hypothetical protein